MTTHTTTIVAQREFGKGSTIGGAGNVSLIMAMNSLNKAALQLEVDEELLATWRETALKIPRVWTLSMPALALAFYLEGTDLENTDATGRIEKMIRYVHDNLTKKDKNRLVITPNSLLRMKVEVERYRRMLAMVENGKYPPAPEL